MAQPATCKRRQLELIAQLGAVLTPVEHVLSHPTDYTPEDRAHVRAAFLVEHGKLSNDIAAFARNGPDGDYFTEWRAIDHPLGQIQHIIAPRDFVENPSLVAQSLPGLKAEVLSAIAAILVRVDDVNREARTPFSCAARFAGR